MLPGWCCCLMGKEADAAKIAADVSRCCRHARGRGQQLRRNDLMQRDGFDVLAALLKPRQSRPSLHRVTSCWAVLTFMHYRRFNGACVACCLLTDWLGRMGQFQW
ncbi:MAG: hypothetical protein IPH54_22450 [Rhodoferax sp.]|nr:hypothetical protein [Rhodoferax sp.]